MTSGFAFPTGTTLVRYTVADAAGNAAVWRAAHGHGWRRRRQDGQYGGCGELGWMRETLFSERGGGAVIGQILAGLKFAISKGFWLILAGFWAGGWVVAPPYLH